MKYLLVALFLFYCKQVNAQNIPFGIEDQKMDAYLMGHKPATFTVQIKNLPDSVKMVKIEYTLVQFGVSIQVTHFTQTDKVGVAKVVLDKNFPCQQVFLKVGDYFYEGVYVNTELMVAIDVSKLRKDDLEVIDGVTYSGVDGELNTVMSKNRLFKREEKSALNKALSDIMRDRKKYSSDLFLSKIDSVKAALKILDNEFGLNFKKYVLAVHNETLSRIYTRLCGAYFNDEMPISLFNDIKNHQPIFTSNDGVFFYNALNMYTFSSIKAKTLDRMLVVLDSLYTQQKSDVLKLLHLATEKDVYSKSYSQLINSIQTQWCKKVVSNELNKANFNQKRMFELFASTTKIEKATIGTFLTKMPFDAELYQLDDLKKIDDFILSLKQKFPNKAFIIDFWATWCSPCLYDLPFSKKLHEQNRDLAVEYIYLCSSSKSTVDLWKNKITDLKIPGTHIFVDKKIIAELKDRLNASAGYPSYASINVNGKINPKAITFMMSLNRESLKAAAGL